MRSKPFVFSIFMIAALTIPILNGDEGSFGFGKSHTWSPNPIAANRFPDPNPVAASATIGDNPRATCGVKAFIDGKNRPGMAVTVEGQILDESLFPLLILPTQTKKTRTDGWARFDYNVNSLNAGGRFIFAARAEYKGNKQLDNSLFYCTLGDSEPCREDNETLCLDVGGPNRFRIRMNWVDPFNGQIRNAVVVQRGASTGRFRFDPLPNLLDTTLINSCKDPNSNSFRLRSTASPLDLKFNLIVTDTKTGKVHHVFRQASNRREALDEITWIGTCP